MFANKNLQIAAGIGIASVITAIVAFGYYSAAPGSSAETFFFALGGKLPEGLIQAATFAAFFTCIFGVLALNQRIAVEETAYMAKLLPETEQYVLYPEDVSRIKLEAIETERRTGPRMLVDLIKQATTKFRAESSTGETLSMVETVSEMQRKSFEKEFWLISTCQTLIPTLGFLGTVLGMAAAILSMGQTQPVAAATVLPNTASTVSATAQPPAPAVTAPDIQALIDSMCTAFFTTILAIVLGIVVSIMVKRLETRAEEFQTNMKRYVVENLVNRIHR